MATSEDHDPASPLRAGPYNRQSHGKATSVEDQDKANESACETNGWTVTSRYSDLVSASRFGTKTRGGWDQLVADVSAGKLDVVVLWDTSRGDRTIETWAAFLSRCRKSDVLIHATSHERTYNPSNHRDWKALIDDGVEAAYESEKKSVDVRRGVSGAAAAGRSHGRPSYGFTRVYDLIDRKKSSEVPTEKIEIAIEIIERVAAEDPLKKIMDDLNGRGIPSPEGREWGTKTIKKIALNPAYVGKRRHYDKLYDATWDGVVDEEVFNRAGEVLRAPDRKHNPPGATRHLLSYLATPPCKGGVLNVQPTRGTCVECGAKGCPDEPCRKCAGEQWREVRPSRYRCHADACVSIDLDALDIYVVAILLARLSREDARTVFAGNDEAAKAARKRVKAIQRELTDLEESAAKGTENGGISLAFAARVEPGIRARLADAEAEYARNARSAVLHRLINAQDIKAEWKRLSVAARRSVVKTLYAKIEVGPATGPALTRWSSADDHLARARDRTVIEWA